MQKQNHMRDPEFEKHIRQRMEELKFSPSETVWNNLEKEIKKDKNRKKPLLWFSFFLVIGLAGSFYFLMNSNKNHNSTDTKSQSTKIPTVQQELQSDTVNDNTVSLDKQKDNQIKDRKAPSVVLNDINKMPASKNKNIITANMYHGRHMNQKNTIDVVEDFLAANQQIKNKKIQEPHNASHKNKAEADLIKNEIVADALSSDNPDNDKHVYINDTVKTKDTNQSESLVIKKADSIVQKGTHTDESTAKNSIIPKQKAKNKKPWEFGFAGGAGVSSIYENLFNTAVAADPFYNQAFSLAAPAPRPTYHTPSPIRSGFSFSAGIFAQKAISKKLNFSAGLNYHYFSTMIKTGNTGTSSITVNRSYTNHYHLLELPVSLSYQFNRSRRFPLLWEAGATLAELIGSDAMHYDNATGSYFKDNHLFNKTELNLATAVMIGLHANKHLYFQVGPQVQYGVTNLLSSKAVGSQHLFFGGIKIVFIPNKK